MAESGVYPHAHSNRMWHMVEFKVRFLTVHRLGTKVAQAPLAISLRGLLMRQVITLAHSRRRNISCSDGTLWLVHIILGCSENNDVIPERI